MFPERSCLVASMVFYRATAMLAGTQLPLRGGTIDAHPRCDQRCHRLSHPRTRANRGRGRYRDRIHGTPLASPSTTALCFVTLDWSPGDSGFPVGGASHAILELERITYYSNSLIFEIWALDRQGASQ